MALHDWAVLDGCDEATDGAGGHAGTLAQNLHGLATAPRLDTQGDERVEAWATRSSQRRAG